MAQGVRRITHLPEAPLAAADHFHSRLVPGLLADLAGLPPGGDMVLVFPPADHAHGGWRKAAVQDLARAAAPDHRLNAIVGTHDPDIELALAYLANAPGVTGQVLELDGNPAKVD